MSEIDFIKTCCRFAEGFSWREPDKLDMPHGSWTFNSSCKNNPSWNFLLYPLLLQRAIEGINNDIDNSLCAIFLTAAFVNVILKGKTVKTYPIYIHQDEHNPDHAKTAALEYVFKYMDK